MKLIRCNRCGVEVEAYAKERYVHYSIFVPREYTGVTSFIVPRFHNHEHTVDLCRSCAEYILETATNYEKIRAQGHKNERVNKNQG